MRDRSPREEYLVDARMGAMYDMLDNYIDANVLTTAPTIFRNVMIHMSDNVDDMRKYPPSGTYDMTSDERQRRIYDSLSSAYATYVPNTSSYDVKNDFVSGDFDKRIDEFDDKFFFEGVSEPQTFVELCDARQRNANLMSHRDSKVASQMLVEGKYGCERRQVPSIVLDRQRDSNLQLNDDGCEFVDRINDEIITARYKNNGGYHYENYCENLGPDYEDYDNCDNDFEF